MNRRRRVVFFVSALALSVSAAGLTAAARYRQECRARAKYNAIQMGMNLADAKQRLGFFDPDIMESGPFKKVEDLEETSAEGESLHWHMEWYRQDQFWIILWYDPADGRITRKVLAVETATYWEGATSELGRYFRYARRLLWL